LHALHWQLLDSDKSGGLDRSEFCIAIKKLVRVVRMADGVEGVTVVHFKKGGEGFLVTVGH
jgi:hypothetical protein